MKFEYRHTFDTSAERLVEALFDPDLAPFLSEHMTTIVSIEPMERTEDEQRIRRKVKYVPVPMISKIGPKKITPESMQWVEESSFDKARRVMTFENIPTHPKVRAKMVNRGELQIQPTGSDRCERIMRGELKIKFPLLGRVAESIIAKNGKKMLDEEAEVVARYMRERR